MEVKLYQVDVYNPDQDPGKDQYLFYFQFDPRKWSSEQAKNMAWLDSKPSLRRRRVSETGMHERDALSERDYSGHVLASQADVCRLRGDQHVGRTLSRFQPTPK